MNKHLDLIIRALVRYQGDDAARARLAFRGMSAEQMNEEHGQSGESRATILAGYENHEKSCAAARAWLEAQFR